MSVKRRVGVVALLAVGFVVVPLWMVASKAGGNLHSRMQRFAALYTSIQSRDPGRIAVEDADADVAIIETLLLPSPGRRQRAREFYEFWRERKYWSIFDTMDKQLEYDEAGDTATQRFLLRTRRVLQHRHYAYVDVWRREDGVWYLEDRREELVAEFDVPFPRPMRP